ncbi:MAG: sialidase family protein [Candidatus Hydrogenedentales bacterium]
MRVIDKGIVHACRQGADQQSCAFPYVCVTRSGRWVCSFRAAPTKAGMKGQRALVTWSDDRGKSWREPIEPFAPMELGGKPGLIRAAGICAVDGDTVAASLYWVDHSDPDLPFFNEETEGLLDSRILLSISHDAGETWSEPRQIDTSPFTMPTPITGPILRIPSGEWACQFELNKHYDELEPWRHASVLMFSPDSGRTWPRYSVVTQDPSNRVFYWDQRPSVLPDGRILDVFWTFDREAAVYLNIHATESRDGGRTWAPLWDTGVPGQPAPVFALADGTLAMPYVDRTSAPTIKIRRSLDGGRSWPAAGEVVLYDAGLASQTWNKSTLQDAWAEMAKFSVGLPTTAAIATGGALVVYYAGTATDETSIHWALVE